MAYLILSLLTGLLIVAVVWLTYQVHDLDACLYECMECVRDLEDFLYEDEDNV